MKINLKLYASLGQYLPENAQRNVVMIDTAEGASPASVLADHGVPSEHCHLVLVNGVYLAPSEREGRPLSEGDSLAVWPPVAGG